jgi:hypothetical protein
MSSPPDDLYQRVHAAADVVRARLAGRVPRVGLILGSGLGGFADGLADPVRIDYGELPDPDPDPDPDPEPAEPDPDPDPEAETETETETESEPESESEIRVRVPNPRSGRGHQGGQERVFVGQVGAQVAQHDRQGQHCRIVGEAGGQVGVVVAMAIGRAEERQVIVLEGLVIGEGLAQSADLGGQGGGADLAGVDGRQERVAAVEEPAQVGVLGRQLRHHG